MRNVSLFISPFKNFIRIVHETSWETYLELVRNDKFLEYFLGTFVHIFSAILQHEKVKDDNHSFSDYHHSYYLLTCLLVMEFQGLQVGVW